MGAGKSTIAKRLSTLLSSKQIDLDAYIEDKMGMSIQEIFTSLGEEAFREIEERCLNEILNDNDQKILIISLGGGTLISDINRQLIKDYTICIYLKASPDILAERLAKSRKTRPLISETTDLKKSIERLFAERSAIYEECASIIIETDGLSANEIIDKIVNSI